MSDTQAVPASNNILESFKRLTERPEIKKATTNQSKIATLSNSDGFKALKEEIDIWIKHLENLSIDPNKDTVESIGFRYLASRVTIDFLNDVKNLPERYEKLQNTQK